MEERKANIMINKVGGNASPTSLNYKLSIPTAWAKVLDITKDSREVKISFDGKQIVIEKE